MEGLDLYNKVRIVPETAQTPIRGGRLKGMTDINPMWRIKTLTEQFGPCGLGWYIETTGRWIEEGANGEKIVTVSINLFVKYGEEWSKPIHGIGGSMFVAKEKGGLYTSDECYKMALTDAISVACKHLGVGADVYFGGDRSKYSGKGNDTTTPQNRPKPDNRPFPPKDSDVDFELKCNSCGKDITKGMAMVSTTKYGKELCVDCQKLQ